METNNFLFKCLAAVPYVGIVCQKNIEKDLTTTFYQKNIDHITKKKYEQYNNSLNQLNMIGIAREIITTSLIIKLFAIGFFSFFNLFLLGFVCIAVSIGIASTHLDNYLKNKDLLKNFDEEKINSSLLDRINLILNRLVPADAKFCPK